MITVHRQGFTDAQNRMIDEAVALGNKVRASLDFVSGIAAMKEPRLMTHLVQSEFLKLDLEFYRPWNPFTSAVAHAQDGVIYLNKRAFKRGVVVQALAQANGNRSEAARQLKVLRASLVRILRKHGIK